MSTFALCLGDKVHVLESADSGKSSDDEKPSAIRGNLSAHGTVSVCSSLEEDPYAVFGNRLTHCVLSTCSFLGAGPSVVCGNAS